MNHIEVSPLTGNIFQGRVNKAGNAFLDGKKDITSQVLRAIIEKAEFHGGEFEIRGAGKLWTVTVKEEAAHGIKENT
jgi:hypothetical protein